MKLIKTAWNFTLIEIHAIAEQEKPFTSLLNKVRNKEAQKMIRYQYTIYHFKTLRF